MNLDTPEIAAETGSVRPFLCNGNDPGDWDISLPDLDFLSVFYEREKFAQPILQFGDIGYFHGLIVAYLEGQAAGLELAYRYVSIAMIMPFLSAAASVDPRSDRTHSFEPEGQDRIDAAGTMRRDHACGG